MVSFLEKPNGLIFYLFINLFIYLFFFQIKEYERLQSFDDRLARAREIYDNFIMKELLSCSHVCIYFTFILIFLDISFISTLDGIELLSLRNSYLQN